MKRVGILGGTFNPIHNAHLNIAKAAYEQLALDEVWFMPAGCPPHKEVDFGVTAVHRAKMVELAIADMPSKFILCNIELAKQEACYTYKTLEELIGCHDNEQIKFFFIIGEDSFLDFSSWRKPERICQLADIIVARRGGSLLSDKAIEKRRKAYEKAYGNKFYILDTAVMELSSSDIRRDISLNNDISSLIPASVAEYIVSNGLYIKPILNDEFQDQLSYIKKQLKQSLKPGRFIHTIGVMETAGRLAKHHDASLYKDALLAGLLHDCAKCLTDEERLRICAEQNIPVTEVEERFPQLLHGKVGAYLALVDFNINNPAVQHAIAVHTTGCLNMSLLDKIIFVADYIEPGRDKAPRLDELRKLAYTNLDLCIYYILEDTVAYLKDKPKSMDPTTLEVLEEYKEFSQITF